MIVTNMVYTTNVGTSIDLGIVHNTVEGVRYEPERFRGLVIKLEYGTCLLFHNGQVVIVGVKTWKDAKTSRDDLVHMLSGLGLNASIGELKLRNIVAYHDFGVKVDLPALYKSLRHTSGSISYEPEISPALMIKMPYTIRIFHNGKAIFTGFQNFTDLDTAFENINKLIMSRATTPQ